MSYYNGSHQDRTQQQQQRTDGSTFEQRASTFRISDHSSVGALKVGHGNRIEVVIFVACQCGSALYIGNLKVPETAKGASNMQWYLFA
jgi:hypothetical protein